VTNLYTPPDVAEAYDAYRANCGPAALAAVLRRPVMSVREFFPQFPARAWTNPTQMRAAADAAGVMWKAHVLPLRRLPSYRGLVLLQIDGPWCDPGVPVGAAYRHTHWVGLDGGMVYDANAGEWLPPRRWADEIMSDIVSRTPRATGWWVRSGIEIFTEAPA
jgi:hypothetical protein